MGFKSSYGKTSANYDGPYEGGQLVHIGTDGRFEVEIQPGMVCKASDKDPSKAYFEGSVRILDEDHAGKTVPSVRVMFIGTDKNGVDFIDKTNDMLISCGLETKESIAQKKASNVPADSDEIIQRVTGTRAYVTITTEMINKGNPRSVVSGFTTKDSYEKSKALGTHRWQPKEKTAAVTNGAASPTSFNAGGGAPAPATAF